jgi:hypothetical protein
MVREKEAYKRKLDKAKKICQECKDKSFDDIIEIPKDREDEYLVEDENGKKYVRKSL